MTHKLLTVEDVSFMAEEFVTAQEEMLDAIKKVNRLKKQFQEAKNVNG